MNLTKVSTLLLYSALVGYGLHYTGSPYVLIAIAGLVFMAAMPGENY